MKAITIRQPYATLMAIGAKTIETRSRQTHYRGELAIHAGLQMMMPEPVVPEFMDELVHLDLIAKPARRREHCHWCWNDIAGEPTPVCTHDYSWSHHTFPRGVILGTCELYDCIPVEKATTRFFQCPLKEKLFGDWSPDRWLWLTQNFKRFDKPIPARGMQGLWNWETK